jgi:hypothetical protein
MDDAQLTATIDHIEHDENNNQLAVLVFDDQQQLILPLDRLPDGCQEGTIITLSLQRNEEETERRRDHIKALQSRLFGTRDDTSAFGTGEKP